MSSLAVNSESVREKIVERIRASFVDLIPQDQWDSLVKQEIAWFTEAPRESYPYYSEPHVSKLRTIIREELEKMFRMMVVKELEKPEHQTSFNGQGEQTPSAFVEEYISENMPLILKAAFAEILSGALSGLRNQLQQAMRPC